MDLSEISENTKMGREYALLGNYETSQVYYQGVLQQIQKLLMSLRSDAAKKQKWQRARQQIAQEYELVKQYSNTLNAFKTSDNVERPISSGISRQPVAPRRDDPSRDPDVWPPPTPVER
ncbi:katanin p60 ATPase-containing subunit A1-like, partial [Saccoglossus kowalevskii]